MCQSPIYFIRLDSACICLSILCQCGDVSEWAFDQLGTVAPELNDMSARSCIYMLCSNFALSRPLKMNACFAQYFSYI